MTKDAFENRINNVTSRFAELVTLMKGLNCDPEILDQMLDHITQSHKNEIQLIMLLDNNECKHDVDVPDFLK